MSENNTSTNQATLSDSTTDGRSNDLAKTVWITDYAWVCGVVGAAAVVLCAIWYYNTNALNAGVIVGGYRIIAGRTDTILAALILCTVAMLLVEVVRLFLRDRGNFFSIHPDIKANRWDGFLVNCLINYALNLSLLYLVIAFYHTAGEYGYQPGNAYYQVWFRFLEMAEYVYLWWGLPYVLITRALKYDALADRRDTSSLFAKILKYFASHIPPFEFLRPEFDELDKKAARALLVKMFFLPLMTVFFYDQFPHLVNNVGYISSGIPDAIANGYYNHARFNADLFNISVASIFSVDVALAWCGYLISSRWVDNQTASAEPTMLGWIVCIICYPPFQMFLGLYYGAPGERDFLHLYENQWAISIFSIMMLLSYFVYMAATLWFGVRFSNLTNRGIIRKGPFAFIRHPAYASKNFSWWCVMFPAILYNAANDGLLIAILQTIGLVLMTYVYYWRAITEERHLSADPYYVSYCQQVKYRFIPGVI